MRITLYIIAFIVLMGGFTAAAYVVYPDQVAEPLQKMANAIVKKQEDIVVYSSGVLGDVGHRIATYDDAIVDFMTMQARAIDDAYNGSLIYVSESVNGVSGFVSETVSGIQMGAQKAIESVAYAPVWAWNGVAGGITNASDAAMQLWNNTTTSIASFLGHQYNSVFSVAKVEKEDKFENIQLANNDYFSNDALSVEMLANIETGAGGNSAGLNPVNDQSPNGQRFQYEIEENVLSAEAVLVPRSKTVISSSRDGQIKKIHFNNGDQFKKDDVLLEYHCDDIKAEAAAATAAKKFASEKQLTTSRLFNMKLASKLEREQAAAEAEQTNAKIVLSELKLNDCQIRAGYDGRVVKKLANDGEYTRTDRVLMEVASEGTLDVEFLLPSRALRWINIDAPLVLNINETGRDYQGIIKQIYGEVDPVSQSIQIRASLDDYDDPLLPGMSGEVSVNIRNVREAGIAGFLETQIP